MNYNQILKENIPFIIEWINKQSQDIKETNSLKKLHTVIQKIEEEKIYSQKDFENIQNVLKHIETLPLKIKRIFNIGKINEYIVFLASKYLETIDDHINLIMTSKKFSKNMEKYFYNPISLTQQTMKFFPRMEVLNIYKISDEYLVGGMIYMYLDWVRRYYDKCRLVKRSSVGNKIHFKKLVWTKNDTERELKENESSLIIPKGVYELEDDCIYDRFKFRCKNLVIPTSVTSIQKKIIKNCGELTNISLPINNFQIVVGNKIFNRSAHFDQDIYLPKSIEVINNKTVEKLSSLIIPSYVTSLEETCLFNCVDLKKLTIPSSISTIPKKCIYKCRNLTNITLPLNESQIIIGNKIFINDSHLEQYIYLPSSLKAINGKKVEGSKIEIPTTVTSLDKKSFKGLRLLLKELIIPTTVQLIPKECFENCKELTNITLPLNESQIILGNKIFKNQPHLEQDIYLPDSIKIINGQEVDGSKMEIPTTITSLSSKCFRNCDDLFMLSIPQSIKIIPFDILYNHILIELSMLNLYYQYSVYGDRLFKSDDNCLRSIQLLHPINLINDKVVKVKDFSTYTIPKNVTSISDYCFANCKELTRIVGLEGIKEFGKGCFKNCPKLNKNQYPKVKQNNENYFNEIFDANERKCIEQWTKLKCHEILFDSIIDEYSFPSTDFNDKIIGKKSLVFLIEDEDGERFGYYLNNQVVEDDVYDGSYYWMNTNNLSFHFNLKSKENRMDKPMKFEIKNTRIGGYNLYY